MRIVLESPSDGSLISGEKKIKAYVPGLSVLSYSLTYSVDGRAEVAFMNSGSLKQVKVNFDMWKWNGKGPYTILLRARDASGKVIGEHRFQLYVRQ